MKFKAKKESINSKNNTICIPLCMVKGRINIQFLHKRRIYRQVSQTQIINTYHIERDLFNDKRSSGSNAIRSAAPYFNSSNQNT
jgi:hypothetical protein